MSKEMVKKEKAGSLVPSDFSEEAGVGFEDADVESFAIPFLKVLQSLSPEQDEDSSDYVDGAKKGKFLQSVTKEIYDSVRLVPIHFTRKITEWVPRASGGGLCGSHDPTAPIVQSATRDEEGKLVAENGNTLVDTRYHYCLLITDTGPQPVIFALKGAEIKNSKQWMSIARNLKLLGKSGKYYNPPSYSHIYTFETVPRQNAKGSWMGLKLSIDRPLDLTQESDQEVYLTAKAFRKQVISGQAKIVHEEPKEESDY